MGQRRRNKTHKLMETQFLEVPQIYTLRDQQKTGWKEIVTPAVYVAQATCDLFT